MANDQSKNTIQISLNFNIGEVMGKVKDGERVITNALDAISVKADQTGERIRQALSFDTGPMIARLREVADMAERVSAQVRGAGAGATSASGLASGAAYPTASVGRASSEVERDTMLRMREMARAQIQGLKEKIEAVYRKAQKTVESAAEIEGLTSQLHKAIRDFQSLSSDYKRKSAGAATAGGGPGDDRSNAGAAHAEAMRRATAALVLQAETSARISNAGDRLTAAIERAVHRLDSVHVPAGAPVGAAAQPIRPGGSPSGPAGFIASVPQGVGGAAAVRFSPGFASAVLGPGKPGGTVGPSQGGSSQGGMRVTKRLEEAFRSIYNSYAEVPEFQRFFIRNDKDIDPGQFFNDYGKFFGKFAKINKETGKPKDRLARYAFKIQEAVKQALELDAKDHAREVEHAKVLAETAASAAAEKAAASVPNVFAQFRGASLNFTPSQRRYQIQPYAGRRVAPSPFAQYRGASLNFPTADQFADVHQIRPYAGRYGQTGYVPDGADLAAALRAGMAMSPYDRAPRVYGSLPVVYPQYPHQIAPYAGRRVSPAPAAAADLFGNPLTPALPEGAGRPGWVGRVPVDRLNTLPSVFQYKAGVQDKFGGTGSLSTVEKWNKDLEGITLVWRRAADGLDYIINGHNRYSLAQRVGQPDLPVKYIDARDDEEARAIGALVNIGEGNGTAVDAAKVFKKYGYTEADLRAKGVPIAKDVARQGLGLANLSDSIFAMVEGEEMTPARGAVIGSRLPSHDLQAELLKLIQKRGSQRLTDGMVAELADMVGGAPKQTVEQQDLFGSFMKEESAVFERADLLDYVRSRLTSDKNVFGGAARNKSKLEAGGNVIDAETSQAIAEAASRNLSVFDTLKNRSGDISRIIDEMSLELKNARGKKERDRVLTETYERVNKAFDVVLAGGEATGPGAGGVDPAGPGGPESRALVRVGPSPNAAANETETERRQREEVAARLRAADFAKQRAAADARARREAEVAARVAAERQRLMNPLGTFNLPGTVEAVNAQTAAQPPPSPYGARLLGPARLPLQLGPGATPLQLGPGQYVTAGGVVERGNLLTGAARPGGPHYLPGEVTRLLTGAVPRPLLTAGDPFYAAGGSRVNYLDRGAYRLGGAADNGIRLRGQIGFLPEASLSTIEEENRRFFRAGAIDYRLMQEAMDARERGGPYALGGFTPRALLPRYSQSTVDEFGRAAERGDATNARLMLESMAAREQAGPFNLPQGLWPRLLPAVTPSTSRELDAYHWNYERLYGRRAYDAAQLSEPAGPFVGMQSLPHKALKPGARLALGPATVDMQLKGGVYGMSGYGPAPYPAGPSPLQGRLLLPEHAGPSADAHARMRAAEAARAAAELEAQNLKHREVVVAREQRLEAEKANAAKPVGPFAFGGPTLGDYAPLEGDPRDPNKLRRHPQDNSLFGEHVPYDDPIASLFPTNVADELGALRRIQQLAAEGLELQHVISGVAQVFENMGEKGERTSSEIKEGMQRVQEVLGGVGSVADHSGKGVAQLESEIAALQKARGDRTPELALQKARFAELDKVRQGLNVAALDNQVAYRSAEADHYAKQQVSSRLRDIEVEFKRKIEEDRAFNVEHELKGDERRVSAVSYTALDGTRYTDEPVNDVLRQVRLDKEQAGADITTASLRMKELAAAEKEATQQAVLMKPALDALRKEVDEMERANTRDVLSERQLTLALKDRKAQVEATTKATQQAARESERADAAGRATGGAGAPNLRHHDLHGTRQVHLATGSYDAPRTLLSYEHAAFSSRISEAATRDYPAVSSAIDRAAQAMDRLRRSNAGYVAELDEVVDEASEFGARTASQWSLLFEGTRQGKQALADLRAEIALDAEAAKKASNEYKDLVETKRQLSENSGNRQDAFHAITGQARAEVETLRALRRQRADIGAERRRVSADGGDTTALDERYAAAGSEVQRSRERLSALNDVKRDLSKTDDVSARSASRLNDVITQSKVRAEAARRALDEKRHAAQQLGTQMRAASGDVSNFGNELFSNLLSANVLANGITNLAHRVKEGVKETILYAARTEELGIAMAAAAKATNTPITSIEAVEKSVKSLNITTQETRETILKFIQAGLDVGKVGKLASVAQDLAVVAGVNTAEELDRLVHGIVTLQPRVLRTAGVFITVREVMGDLAAETGRTMTSFSELEKQQATLQAVLEKGARVTGLYDEAMNSASKQMRSLDREFKEAMNAVGDFFIPALYLGVNALRILLQTIQASPASFVLFTGSLALAVATIGLMSSALHGGALFTGLTHLWVTLKTVAAGMYQVATAGGFAAAGINGVRAAAVASGFGVALLAVGALAAGLVYLATSSSDVADANDRLLSQAALKVQVYEKDLLFLKQNREALLAGGAAVEQFNAIRDQQLAADSEHIKRLQEQANAETDATKRVELRAQAIDYLNDRLKESIELYEVQRRQQLQQSVAKTLATDKDADGIAWGIGTRESAWSSQELLARQMRDFQARSRDLRGARESLRDMTSATLGRPFSAEELSKYYSSNVAPDANGLQPDDFLAEYRIKKGATGQLNASEENLTAIFKAADRVKVLREQLKALNADIAVLREESEEAEKQRELTAKRFATDYADSEEAKLKLFRREFPKATEDEVRQKLDAIREETKRLREEDFDIYESTNPGIQRLQILIDKELELRRLQGERLSGTASAVNEINDAVGKIKLPEFDVKFAAQGAAVMLGGIEDKVAAAVKGYTRDVTGFVINEDEGGLTGQTPNPFTGREELALAINRLKGDPAGFKSATAADRKKAIAQELASGLSDADVRRFVAGVSAPLLTAAQQQGRDVARALLGTEAAESEVNELGREIVRNISPATAELLDFANMNGDAATRVAELGKSVRDTADALRDFTMASPAERGLSAQLELVKQFQSKVQQVSALRVELGLPDDRNDNQTLRELDAELATLSRLKSAREEIFKLTQAQEDAEARLAVAMQSAYSEVVDAETLAAQKYLEGVRQKREAEQQLTADIIFEIKRRQEARAGTGGELGNAQLKVFGEYLRGGNDLRVTAFENSQKLLLQENAKQVEEAVKVRDLTKKATELIPTVQQRIERTNEILLTEVATRLDRLIQETAAAKVQENGTGQTKLSPDMDFDGKSGPTIERIKEAINRSAGANGVDPALIYYVMKRESSFNPTADNPLSSAAGLMQIIAKTRKRFGVTDPYDIEQSTEGGTKYLRELLNMFKGFPNQIELAIGGYFLGEGKIIKNGYAVPYDATDAAGVTARGYVAEVYDNYKAHVAKNGGNIEPGFDRPDVADVREKAIASLEEQQRQQAVVVARERRAKAVEERRAKAEKARKDAEESRKRAQFDRDFVVPYGGAPWDKLSPEMQAAVNSRIEERTKSLAEVRQARAETAVGRRRLLDLTVEDLNRSESARQKKLDIEVPRQWALGGFAKNQLLVDGYAGGDAARAEVVWDDRLRRQREETDVIRENIALKQREADGYVASEEFKLNATLDADNERMRQREATSKELLQLTDAEARGLLDSEQTKRQAVESSQAAFKRAYAETHKELHALRAEEEAGFYQSEAFKRAAVEEQEAERRRARRDTARQLAQAEADERAGYLASAGFVKDAWRQAYLQRRADAEGLARSIISLEDKLAHAGEDAAQRYRKAWLEAVNEIKDRDIQAVESQIRSAEELKDAQVVHSEQVRSKILEHLASQKTATQAYADAVITIYEGVAGGWDKLVDKMTKKFGFFGSAMGELLKQKGRSILTGFLVDVVGVPELADLLAPQKPEDKMASAADRLLESSKHLDDAAQALSSLGAGAGAGAGAPAAGGFGRIVAAFRGARTGGGGWNPLNFIRNLFGGARGASGSTPSSSDAGPMGVGPASAGGIGGAFPGGLTPFLLSGAGGGNSGASMPPIFGSGSASNFAARFFGLGGSASDISTVTDYNDAVAPGVAPGRGGAVAIHQSLHAMASPQAGGGFASLLRAQLPQLGSMLPYLGMSFGAGLGGPSRLGSVLGMAGGFLAGGALLGGLASFGSAAGAGIGAFGPLAGLFSNPATAIIGGALLLGAVILGRNKQRQLDEKKRAAASHDLGSGVWKLIDDVRFDRIDGASALAQADQLEAAYKQNITQIKDGKTRRHAELWLKNDYPQVRKTLERVVDDQNRRREIDRKLIPEFAGGGAVGTSLAMVKPGEVVLGPADVASLGGPSVMAAAGVPGFAAGGPARYYGHRGSLFAGRVDPAVRATLLGRARQRGGFRGVVPGVDRGVDDTLIRAEVGSAVLNRQQQSRLAGLLPKFAGGGAVYGMMGGSGAYGLTSFIPAFQFGGFVPLRDGSITNAYATGGEVPAPAPIAPIAPLSTTINSRDSSGESDQTIQINLDVALNVDEEAASGIVVKGLKSSTGQRVLLGTIRNLKRQGEIK